MDLERKNRAYRRALALGLTLAEIFLLLVFVLLLAFAASYKRFVDSSLKSSGPDGQPKPHSSPPKNFGSGPNNFDDLFRKLGLCEEQTSKAEQEKRRWQGEAGHCQEQSSDAEREQQRLQGELANAQKKLLAAGRGTEMPPCWVTPDGTIEYIFDVTLASNGVLVHDNTLPDHSGDEKKLVPAMTFDSVLNRDQFLSATQRLYEWSRAQHPECRFFVHVLDRTKADEKAIYKGELQTVEGHFYKLLVNDVPATGRGD